MTLLDAHCHLDQLQDPHDAVRRAKDASVARILSVSENSSSAREVLALKAAYPDVVLAGQRIDDHTRADRMAHAHLHDVEAETVKASSLLILTLMGGMLVISSFVVDFPIVARTLFQYEITYDAGGVRGISNPWAFRITS